MFHLKITVMLHYPTAREELVQPFVELLQSYGFSSSTISSHLTALRRMFVFMEENDIAQYEPAIGNLYLNCLMADPLPSKAIKQHARAAITLLNNGMEGKEYTRARTKDLSYHWEGIIGQEAEKYLKYLEKDRLLSPSTVRCNGKLLESFAINLKRQHLDLHDVTWDVIISHITSLERRKDEALTCLKCFFMYLHENRVVKDSFFELFRSVHLPKKAKLPSVYTIEEVRHIEKSISRLSAKGKRDYAMLLCASRLGLRTSDISLLQYSNIDWHKNEIRLVQYKTKVEIVLPLLPDVGNAIRDYTLHGRPKVKEQRVFISHSGPFLGMTPCSVSCALRDRIRASGVEANGRKQGAHSLRHSLATNMLMNDTTLPVISSILGHSSTESTKTYLSVDIKHLLECALEVPMVDKNFYIQKGGILYD